MILLLYLLEMKSGNVVQHSGKDVIKKTVLYLNK